MMVNSDMDQKSKIVREKLNQFVFLSKRHFHSFKTAQKILTINEGTENKSYENRLSKALKISKCCKNRRIIYAGEKKCCDLLGSEIFFSKLFYGIFSTMAYLGFYSKIA